MLKRKLVRKRHLYEFMLKATYEYYRDKFKEFLALRQYDETLCPSIYKIDEVMLNLRSKKTFINKKAKGVSQKQLANWNFFINIDI